MANNATDLLFGSQEQNYSTPILECNYNASKNIIVHPDFERSVMKLSDVFLNSLFPNNDFIPEEVKNDPESLMDNLGSISDWVTSSGNFMGALVIGILFVIIMFIAGIVWCCGRCFCSFGKAKPFNFLAMLIEGIIMAVMIFFTFLVCIWILAANDHTQDGLDRLPNNVKIILKDAGHFIGNTAQELEHVAQVNLDEFMNLIKIDIDDLTDSVGQTVDNVKGDLELERINSMSNFFLETANNFEDVKKLELKIMLEQWNGEAEDLKTEFESFQWKINEFCNLGVSNCDGFLPQVNSMDFNTNILPSSLILDSIEIDQATRNQLNSMKIMLSDANNMINDFSDGFFADKVKDIDKQLQEIGNTLDENLGDLISSMKNMSKDIDKQYVDIEPTLETAQDIFTYVHVGFVLLGLFCLLIVGFYFVSLILGPFGIHFKFLNGGNFVCAGTCSFFTAGKWMDTVTLVTILTLISGAFLWLLATIFMVVGSLTDHLLCTTLQDPASSEIVPYIDQLLNEGIGDAFNSTSNLTLPGILDDCRQDKSLYKAMQLKNAFDVQAEFGDWKTKFNITGMVTDVKGKVGGYLGDITSQVDISQFSGSMTETADNFKRLEDEIIDPVINMSIDKVFNLQEFLSMREPLEKANAPDEILTDFDDLVDEFQAFQSEIKKGQNSTAVYNENNLHFEGNFSVSETVILAGEIATNAQKSLMSNGSVRAAIDVVVDTSIDSLLTTADGFVSYILDYVVNQFAKCSPISGVYDLLGNSICYQILQPFNGIWTGFGLYLILMIPVLILSCLLEPLFRGKQEKKGPVIHSATKVKPIKQDP